MTACKHQYRARSVTVVLSYLRYGRQDLEERIEEISRLRPRGINHKAYKGSNNSV